MGRAPVYLAQPALSTTSTASSAPSAQLVGIGLMSRPVLIAAHLPTLQARDMKSARCAGAGGPPLRGQRSAPSVLPEDTDLMESGLPTASYAQLESTLHLRAINLVFPALLADTRPLLVPLCAPFALPASTKLGLASSLAMTVQPERSVKR